ncbi:MAG: hypothetical protein ACK5FE_13980 [Cyanobacteriota bacterium]|jgi:hypothetical protein
MIFKRKFFLDLSGEGADQKPVVVAPVAPVAPVAKEKPQAAPAAQPAAAQTATAQTAAAQPAAATTTAAAAAATGLTTAEAIAAELAADQANRPAPSKVTFADARLVPGANPSRRRRVGANLAAFKDMAKGMMR